MNKKILIGSAALSILILIIFFSYSRKHTNSDSNNTYVDEQKRMNGPCPGPLEVIEMKDPLMPVSLPIGKKFKVLPNYYACHPVKAGDLVYFRFSSALDPVARRVAAVPGNSFKLVQKKNEKNWEIEIDGDIYKDPSKKPHFFGTENTSLVGLYEKSSKGKLLAKNFLVFTEVSPGERDSGTLGVVNSDDFLGKIEVE